MKFLLGYTSRKKKRRRRRRDKTDKNDSNLTDCLGSGNKCFLNVAKELIKSKRLRCENTDVPLC